MVGLGLIRRGSGARATAVPMPRIVNVRRAGAFGHAPPHDPTTAHFQTSQTSSVHSTCRQSSTMSLPKTHQCCTLPPAVAEYSPKGTYGELAGLKTYYSGPEDSDKAILFVYDVFGFSNQILQGADLLAGAGFRVAMPDLLHGSYCTPDMFSGTPDGNAKRDAYFSGFPGVPSTQSDQLKSVTEALKAQGIKSIGVVGFCWGWKAIATAKNVGDFSAIASPHPSFVDASDAENITSPTLLLPSQGEDRTAVDALVADLEKKIPGKVFVKWYPEDVHGFAAARADLKDPKQLASFHDAYVQLLNFFKQYV